MREIGGYLELDTYSLPMLHEGALALNCGRNALAYLLRAKGIRRIRVPKLICNSVIGVCEREHTACTLYGVGEDLLPKEDLRLEEDEWLYVVNYYSQIPNETLARIAARYGRVIADNAQSYFQPPLPGTDTIYTCRKYFGVADGAFLYTDAAEIDLPVDESYARMGYVLGRYERPASEFYAAYTENNRFFSTEPVKRMSKLTNNLLHAIDYAQVKKRREANYALLHDAFGEQNLLRVSGTGTFMYPLLIENGAEIRKRLLEEKIYIPTLWPGVLTRCKAGDVEYTLTTDLLPLPIDQRYGEAEMNDMKEIIRKCMRI